MRIVIDYLQNTREASIKTNELSKAWIAITRACQDNTDTNLIRQNDREIVLPWWSFLLAKESIGYHIARNNAQIEFSDDAKLLLEKAIQKLDLYENAKEAVWLTEEEVKIKLEANDFV
jgi:hypothetical protein